MFKKLSMVLLVIVLIISFTACGGDDETEETSQVENETTYEEPATTPEVEEEPVQEEEIDEAEPSDFETREEYMNWVEDKIYKETGKTAYEYVREMGWKYFAGTNWDGVFTYQCDVHYIADYNFRLSYDDEDWYGYYVAYSSADIQNAYGAYINSCIYIYMNEWGDVSYVCYEESDGSLVELPIY